MSGQVKPAQLLTKLHLQGIDLAPAQVFGGVRLVPLLRPEHREDLRLSKTVYAGGRESVQLPKDRVYSAYIPHGLVANWHPEGGTVRGTRVSKSDNNNPATGVAAEPFPLKRMARRTQSNSIRFLPLHIAMEGYLSHHFDAPDIAWTEYRRDTLQHGLQHRWENVLSGRQIIGLEDALRVFEIHQNQIGLLLFVADTLAAAFVVPHPDDYRVLHRTLVTDFYGELIFYYGLHAVDTKLTVPAINAERVSSFDDLRSEVDQIRRNWADWHQSLTGSLFNRTINATGVHRFHPFTLQRFNTGFNPDQDNHIGDMIVDEDHTIQYMKTFRLSANQCKRAYLLSRLAAVDWHLDTCADQLGCEKNELITRLNSAGFGYLLHQHVLDGAKASQKRR